MSPCLFPTTITITPRAPPDMVNLWVLDRSISNSNSLLKIFLCYSKGFFAFSLMTLKKCSCLVPDEAGQILNY